MLVLNGLFDDVYTPDCTLHVAYYCSWFSLSTFLVFQSSTNIHGDYIPMDGEFPPHDPNVEYHDIDDVSGNTDIQL